MTRQLQDVHQDDQLARDKERLETAMTSCPCKKYDQAPCSPSRTRPAMNTLFSVANPMYVVTSRQLFAMWAPSDFEEQQHNRTPRSTGREEILPWTV